MINQQMMNMAQQGQEQEASPAAERIFGNIADVVWTPKEEGGGFEDTLAMWNDGGAKAVGAFAGSVIRDYVDRMEVGANAEEQPVEVPREDLMTIGAEVINEMFEAIATQVESGAQPKIPFPQSEEEQQDAQGEALIAAIDSYTSTQDPKLDPEPAMNFAMEFFGGQNGSE